MTVEGSQQPDPDDDLQQEEGPGRSTLTYRDWLKPREGRSLRKLAGLVRSSIRLTYEAAPRLFVLTTALDVLSGLGVGAQLLIAKEALQILLSGKSTSHFPQAIPYLIALFVVTVLLALASSAEAEQGRVLGEQVTRLAYDRIFGVSERIELAAFESPQFFDRLQRAIINGSSRPIQMTTGLTKLITSAMTVLAISAVIAKLVPVLLPIALIAYIPLWLAMAKNSRGLYEFMYRMISFQRQRIYLMRVRSGRDEAKEIRAFGLSPLIKTRYDGLYDQYIDGVRSLARMRIRRSLVGSIVSSAITVVVLGFLGYLYLDRNVSLAVAGTAVAALLQLSSQLQSFLQGAASLYEGSLFLGDYESFVGMNSEFTTESDRNGPNLGPEKFRKITAESVSFTYPGTDRAVLHDVSVEINAGEIVALVGENGSGKTTLAKVLAGLYRPDNGEVKWDGRDIRTLNPEAVRDSIAVIFQDFIRYLMSARENIAAGKWQAMDDTDRLRDAAVAANADSFLSRLPEGYETILGKEFDGGYDLSLGQWQRVALARAFFRHAPFVILDEPTSALDPRAERALFDRIRELFSGQSVLLISHRFSSVRSADRVYVLEQGRVKESGTHAALMAQQGLYAELFTLQAAAYLTEDV